MAAADNDPHRRLYNYVGMLLVAIIVAIYGLTSLPPPDDWMAAILGGGVAVYAGFEVNVYRQTIQASQGGRNNKQVNQTNPQQSPNFFGPVDT